MAEYRWVRWPLGWGSPRWLRAPIPLFSEEETRDSTDVDRMWSDYPALDVAEGDDSLSVMADVPGMDKEKFKVSVSEGVLEISGEREAPCVPEGAKLRHRERPCGRFMRRVRLHVPVAREEIRAKYENGILELTIPKAQEARVCEIPIEG